MLRVLIASLLAVHCSAVPSYGGYGLGLGGYGGGLGGYGLGGLGGGYGGLVLDGGHGHGAHVNAAILSHRTIQVVPHHSNYGSTHPTVVDIDSSEQPVILNFNSRSSPLHATQNHHGQHGSHQSTHSVDEPHVLTHEVTRPVIQEIREVIVPQRNVVQEIKPVVENVQTIVAKGVGHGTVLGGELASGLAYGKISGVGLSGYGGGYGGLSSGLGLTSIKGY